MAHFAKIDENNVVTQIIVIDNKELIDPHTNQEDELLGSAFCKKLLGGNWVQTSYNDNMRVRYAAVGDTYDKTLDAFVPPQPFASWVLDTDNVIWRSPLGDAPELTEEEVEARSFYSWDEEAYQVDNTTGWILETPEVSE